MLNEFVSNTDLMKVEAYLDKLFSSLNIDIEFTKHFYDRVNHPRNNDEITPQELIDTFNKLYKKHGTGLINYKELEGVITDFNSDINVPFHLLYDKKTKTFELANKTIMRTKKFHLGNSRPFRV